MFCFVFFSLLFASPVILFPPGSCGAHPLHGAGVGGWGEIEKESKIKPTKSSSIVRLAERMMGTPAGVFFVLFFNHYFAPPPIFLSLSLFYSPPPFFFSFLFKSLLVEMCAAGKGRVLGEKHARKNFLKKKNCWEPVKGKLLCSEAVSVLTPFGKVISTGSPSETGHFVRANISRYTLFYTTFFFFLSTGVLGFWVLWVSPCLLNPASRVPS